MKGPLDASIVIPTRDRPGSLARCLDALERQTFAGSLEILVVDDGSQDLELVANTVGRSPRAKLLANHGRGPAAARNRGAAEAHGRAVLFVDDDCEPAAEWAGRLVEALFAGADAVAGKTVNARPEDRVAEASQTIANYLHTWSTQKDGREIFAASNNLACTAEVMGQVPFDERFPNAGGEDRDWCSRLTEAGFHLVSEWSAVVVHRQHLTLPGFFRQQLNYGRGAYLFRLRRGSPWRLAPVGFYGGLLRAAFERGPVVGGLVALAQAATAGGYALAALSRERRAAPQ